MDSLIVLLQVVTLAAIVGVGLKLGVLSKGIKRNMAAIDDELTALQAQVATDTTVEQSAVTLINGISAQIAAAVAAAQAAGATPAQLAEITAITTSLGTNNTALAAAVAANTPAAPAPPAPPAT